MRWWKETDAPDIAELKDKARRAYERFHAIAARLDYPCGHEMLKHINGDASEAANTFNACMAQLERIDPACPIGKRL